MSQIPKTKVVTAHGYGLSVTVQRGHLIVEDGVGKKRRSRRFNRAKSRFDRLVVQGHSGIVSLDALRWLSDVSAAFVHLDSDGTLLTVSVPGELNDVRVRRGQAYAAVNGVGISIVRDLLREKIRGQRRVAEQLNAPDDLMEWMRDAETVLPDSHSITDLRLVEARAAAAYWQAWEGVAVHFPRSERKTLPSHWLRYDARHSVLSNSPRRATNPVNAILNYLYSILEAEARIALRLVGADPGMGLLHVDNSRRASFALDLMEPVRPKVDAYVLGMLANHTFSGTDFFETREGDCRLMPSITKAMAATGSRWTKAVAPFAEQMAGRFAAASEHLSAPIAEPNGLPERFRTPLTQRNRKLARGGKPAPVRRKALDKVCRRCGRALANLDRTYCTECRHVVRSEQAARGRAKLEQLKVEGRDERSSDRVREKKARVADRNNRENASWEQANPGVHEPEVFRREIAPGLKHLTGRELVEVTGLSLVYSNQVRRGQRVPHPRHWDALRTLAEAAPTVGRTDPEFYRETILPRLSGFTAGEIAEATGLSVSYCKRIRQGTRMPQPRWWSALEMLALSGGK